MVKQTDTTQLLISLLHILVSNYTPHNVKAEPVHMQYLISVK